MSTTNPYRASPSTAAPMTAAYGLVGSPLAVCWYEMTARPMPPVTPVDTSDTITPTTDSVAASLAAGTMCGTAAGNRSFTSVRHHDAA